MRIPLLAALATLAACSPADVGNRTADPADVNAAAAEAQGDIDRYAADRATRRSPFEPTPAATAAPTIAAPADDAEPGADAAVAIAQAYFDALAARDFAAAYRLWDGDGRASGLSAAQFAASYARYTDYRGTLGQPGRIDSGAGQRYIEIPAQVAATLADGKRSSSLRGSIVLHRAGPIDGATAGQRQWRVSAATLKPATDPAPAGTATEPDPG